MEWFSGVFLKRVIMRELACYLSIKDIFYLSMTSKQLYITWKKNLLARHKNASNWDNILDLSRKIMITYLWFIPPNTRGISVFNKIQRRMNNGQYCTNCGRPKAKTGSYKFDGELYHRVYDKHGQLYLLRTTTVQQIHAKKYQDCKVKWARLDHSHEMYHQYLRDSCKETRTYIDNSFTVYNNRYDECMEYYTKYSKLYPNSKNWLRDVFNKITRLIRLEPPLALYHQFSSSFIASLKSKNERPKKKHKKK